MFLKSIYIVDKKNGSVLVETHALVLNSKSVVELKDCTEYDYVIIGKTLYCNVKEAKNCYVPESNNWVKIGVQNEAWYYLEDVRVFLLEEKVVNHELTWAKDGFLVMHFHKNSIDFDFLDSLYKLKQAKRMDVYINNMEDCFVHIIDEHCRMLHLPLYFFKWNGITWERYYVSENSNK